MRDCEECKNFEPKEKRPQKGWVCDNPDCTSICYRIPCGKGPPINCTGFGGANRDRWRPFYGKVVE